MRFSELENPYNVDRDRQEPNLGSQILEKSQKYLEMRWALRGPILHAMPGTRISRERSPLLKEANELIELCVLGVSEILKRGYKGTILLGDEWGGGRNPKAMFFDYYIEDGKLYREREDGLYKSELSLDNPVTMGQFRKFMYNSLTPELPRPPDNTYYDVRLKLYSKEIGEKLKWFERPKT